MSYCKKPNSKLNEINPLKKIILYDDPATSNLRLSEIKKYLSLKLKGVKVIIREEFFNYQVKSSSFSELAVKLANTKIRDLMNNSKVMSPLLGEIRFEEKLLSEPVRSITGILYDGIKLHDLYQELLKANEIKTKIYHIIFTSRLFSTFDDNDRRYHARVILCGYPSFISTSGIVEAPAKPKEYYKIKQNLLRQNITTIDEFIPTELKQKYLQYNDLRITEILKGYVMQAVFYHLTSEPFCSNPHCRLYNAHWQEELINAQLSKPEFCFEHENILTIFNEPGFDG